MRGYNLSDKPLGVRAYRVELLARDVERLILACGEQTAVVVGHDWGAIAAWIAAMRHPERVEKLAILNVPHPARSLDGLLSPMQLLRSSYMFFFQIPRLPEEVIRAGDFGLLRSVFRSDPVQPEALTAEDIERYIEAIAQPGVLTASLNYYRALLRNPREMRALLQRVEAPVLVIWGERDRFLSRRLAEPPRLWVPNLVRVKRLPDASHWVAEDCPLEVNTPCAPRLSPSRVDCVKSYVPPPLDVMITRSPRSRRPAPAMSTFICRTLTNMLLLVRTDRGCLDLGDRATPTSGAFEKMWETG
jgi:pimeloyl-ACP methyl ester carboxylesterase